MLRRAYKKTRAVVRFARYSYLYAVDPEDYDISHFSVRGEMFSTSKDLD